MRPRHWIGLVAVFLAASLATVLLATQVFQPAPNFRLGPEHPGPRTVVSLGDSTISGEGAGAYLPGTDGRGGNWCHRSARAQIQQVRLPGVQRRVNLACSGAAARHVGLGGPAHYTEGSQAEQLGRLARSNNVVAVLVGVGANDDPQFGRTIRDCFQQWITNGEGCAGGDFEGQWRARVDAMVPKVVSALRDVRAALRDAGYEDDDYELVLQSYASPVGTGVPDPLRGLAGCPFQERDTGWFAATGTPLLADGLRRAAAQTGTRFLDISRAARGHEACTGGADESREWFTRLTVRWPDLADAERAGHAIQESFHPNARGHAQFARCLRQFLVRDDRNAACLPGPDGSLNAATQPTP